MSLAVSFSSQLRLSLWYSLLLADHVTIFGTIAINLLNAETVKEAAREIQTGRHVQLDWPMNNVEFPGFGRIPIEHNVKEMEKEGFLGLDDEIKINTQTSSQWDSLKHASLLCRCFCVYDVLICFLQWSIQKEGVFYNGMSIKEALQSPRNGLHSKTLFLSFLIRGAYMDDRRLRERRHRWKRHSC